MNEEQIIEEFMAGLVRDLERQAHYSLVPLSFNEEISEIQQFLEEHHISFVQFQEILNICRNRQYFEQWQMGGTELRLTDQGFTFGQGINRSRTTRRNEPQQDSVINIGTINSSGPVQVGNNNTQENVDMSRMEPKKNGSTSFFLHPLVVGIIVVVVGAIVTVLLKLIVGE